MRINANKALVWTARRMVWKRRVTGLINLAMLPVLARFWAVFALVSETLPCRIGCAWLSLGTLVPCYAIYHCVGFRGLPEERGLAASLRFYRANLVRSRDSCANPLYSTMLAQAPGAVLGIAGWILSSPEHWFNAAEVGLFFVGLTLATWRIGQREAARLQREIDLLLD
jgi:hypothetical protein